MKTVIAISKGSGDQRYLNYAIWLQQLQPDIVCKDLSVLNQEDALKVIHECSGLLLTGGPDIDPTRYNRPDAKEICECDLPRDTDEWAYVDLALAEKKPILGICRGMQLLNVYFGGTLIPDIPSARYSKITHSTKDADVEHAATVIDSDFEKMLGTNAGVINSRHHQAVDAIAPQWVVYAQSPDGIVEAIGRNDNSSPFMMAVQWHPERMDGKSPFSKEIGLSFLMAAQKCQTLFS